MRGFGHQLRGELRKLFARRRTHLGFAAFTVVALLMPALLKLEAAQRFLRRLIEEHFYAFDEYFSGPTLALLTLRTTVLLLGALYVALVAGDLVAKEVEDGSMRLLLSRPVSRFRVLAPKFAALSIYTFALTTFIGLAALASGWLHGGAGGLLALGPFEQLIAFHPLGEGLSRYLIALPLLALSLHSVAALGFMFSCFRMKPAAASAATLAICFTDFVLRTLPFFAPFERWFLTPRLGVWLQVFQPGIPWAHIVETCAVLFALDATWLIAGWLVFEESDIRA